MGLAESAHTCCFLMNRISRCSHEPAWPEPTPVLPATLYLRQIDHKSSLKFLNVSSQKHRTGNKSIINCMAHLLHPATAVLYLWRYILF